MRSEDKFLKTYSSVMLLNSDMILIFSSLKVYIKKNIFMHLIY